MQGRHHSESDPPGHHGFMGSRAALILIVFLAIAGYFLWTEHRAHVIQGLPWLLLLACPLMHLFMHGSHGGHGHDDSKRGGGA